VIWVLGNLSGESTASRDIVLSAGALRPLGGYCMLGWRTTIWLCNWHPIPPRRSVGNVKASSQCVHAAHRLLGHLQPVRRAAETRHGRGVRYTLARSGTYKHCTVSTGSESESICSILSNYLTIGGICFNVPNQVVSMAAFIYLCMCCEVCATKNYVCSQHTKQCMLVCTCVLLSSWRRAMQRCCPMPAGPSHTSAKVPRPTSRYSSRYSRFYGRHRYRCTRACT